MIPRVIHYCWFGGKNKPKLAEKCINSWQKYCHGYEIKEWNENNFDVNFCEYTKEAYEAKKYAFVSDVARFWILYNYGGIYFDTDVEVIKSIDEIVSKGAFMGCEVDGGTDKSIACAPGLGMACNPGLGMACNPGLGIIKELLYGYNERHFIINKKDLNLKTVVEYTTELLFKHGLKNVSGIQKIDDIYIYPTEYFCPKSVFNGEITIKPNTYTIHHFAASWRTRNKNWIIYDFLLKIYGKKIADKIREIVKRIKR